MTAEDPVTRYAHQVLDGTIVAGRLVKQACVRHLSDLQHAAAKGLEWRPAAAQEGIDFFAEVLFLPENTPAGEDVTDGELDSAPKPFILEPWQQFIVGS